MSLSLSLSRNNLRSRSGAQRYLAVFARLAIFSSFSSFMFFIFFPFFSAQLFLRKDDARLRLALLAKGERGICIAIIMHICARARAIFLLSLPFPDR